MVCKYVNTCRSCTVGKSHEGRGAGFSQVNNVPIRKIDIWHIDHARLLDDLFVLEYLLPLTVLQHSQSYDH